MPSSSRQVMPQETQVVRADSNPSLPAQPHIFAKTESHFEQPKKREWGEVNSSGTEQTETKRSRSKRLKSQGGEPDILNHQFACPFYERDQHEFGGQIGCAIYGSRDVATMLRHHILGKHRARNKITQYIDDSRFEKLKDIKIKGLELDKKKKDEMKWRAIYETLFQVSPLEDIEVPSPYFDPDKHRSSRVGAIEECCTTRNAKDPASDVESLKLSHEIAKLKAKWEHEKCEVYERTAAEESSIRARREQQLQNIDSRYETEISKFRQRLMDLLLDEPKSHTPPRTFAPPLLTMATGVDAPSSAGFTERNLLHQGSEAREFDDVCSNTPNATDMPTPRFENTRQEPYYVPYPAMDLGLSESE